MPLQRQIGNPKSQIRLVVFDLGRVLIRICDDWKHACAIAGVAVPPGELAAPSQAALNALVCAVEVGDLDLAAFASAVAPNLGLSSGDVVRLHNAYLRGPYPGAFELLGDLRRSGVATACLSNTNANHWRLMTDPSSPNYMAFDDTFTHVFASHLVRLRKPDDCIYAHVEQSTGAGPDEIVFFDDVPENIAAAATRGWRAHAIRIDADPIAQARTHLAAYRLLSDS